MNYIRKLGSSQCCANVPLLKGRGCVICQQGPASGGLPVAWLMQLWVQLKGWVRPLCALCVRSSLESSCTLACLGPTSHLGVRVREMGQAMRLAWSSCPK